MTLLSRADRQIDTPQRLSKRRFIAPSREEEEGRGNINLTLSAPVEHVGPDRNQLPDVNLEIAVVNSWCQ